MRIFRYWVREHRHESRGGNTVEGWVFGGSNVSEQAAAVDLENRWNRVLARVFEGKPRDTENYEADIREEIVMAIDDNTVITRNRYGAEILNCTSPVIVDMDAPAPSFWKSLFGRAANTEEERIAHTLDRLRKIVEKRKCGIRGVRLYRTPAGLRAIVASDETAPASSGVRGLMRLLSADQLYFALCIKQNCYRARLTAKPKRIGHKTLNQSWPVDEEQARAREAWVASYRMASSGYAACAFLEAIGEVPHSPVIDLHDQRSGALTGKSLA
jgi:hypothetical protein